MSEFTNWNSALCHHGIRGQKWGKRRWQNEDGSLTEAGRRRYGTVENYERLTNKKKPSEMTDEELRRAIDRKKLENEYKREATPMAIRKLGEVANKFAEYAEKREERNFRREELANEKAKYDSEKATANANAKRAKADAKRAKAEIKKSKNEYKIEKRQLKTTDTSAKIQEAKAKNNTALAKLTEIQEKSKTVEKMLKKNSLWSAITGKSVNDKGFLGYDRVTAVQSFLESKSIFTNIKEDSSNKKNGK